MTHTSTTGVPREMKLRIDADACTGHGRCYVLAPEVFEPDDEGHSVGLVDDIPARPARQGAAGRRPTAPRAPSRSRRRLRRRVVDELVDEVDRSPDGPTVGAFFDFDGTLIYGFSALALQVARLRRRDVSPQEVAHSLVTGVGLVLGQADYDAVVSILGRAVAWPVDRGDRRDRAQVVQAEARRARLPRSARARRRAPAQGPHRRAGVVGAVVPGGGDGRRPRHRARALHPLRGGRRQAHRALAGPHLWGAGKRRAVEQLAKALGIDLGASFAYADGSEDVELLELVGNPRPTNPTRGLERKARERGWPVHRFVGPPGPDPRAGGAPRRRARRLPHRHRHRHRPRAPQPQQGRRGQHDDLGRQRRGARASPASTST